MPRTIGGNSGLVRSGTSTPTVSDRLVFRLRAIGLTWYPRDAATSRTRATVAGRTRLRVASLSAREAVAGCTPAAVATSRSVGRGATGGRVGGAFISVPSGCAGTGGG